MPDLADGESTEMKGSGAKPYALKNVGGVYSCSCPAWRNQSVAIEKRSCKHLRKLRGDEAEKERTGGALPVRKSAAKDDSKAPPLLLAHNWNNAQDIQGWWMSEKLDGVRAYWDGARFLSRLGNEFHAPAWFVAALPKQPLDGELWIGRKQFQQTVSVARRQDPSDHWKEMRYVVFDAPEAGGPFEERLAFLRDALRQTASEYASILEQQVCRDIASLEKELERIDQLGGEGLMLREPGSLYEAGRSMTLLKIKRFHDAEAVVIDHDAGRGRHKGRLGSLRVRLPDGVEFSVGTGFSDKQRADPPAVGSTVTFRYQELTDGGVPRFPSFIRLHTPAGGARAAELKSPSKPPVTEKPQDSASQGSERRRFEFNDEKSNKFWEINRSGCEIETRWGRIGTDGQSKTKSFKDEATAEAKLEKMIEEKTGKGYTETG